MSVAASVLLMDFTEVSASVIFSCGWKNKYLNC
jgi:hypothetical protein